MEHTTQTAPNPSEQEKQAIFARVWKRVMAGQEAACPLTWTDPVPQAETAADPAPAPADPGRGQGSPPCRWPAPPPSPEETFPRRRRRGCWAPGAWSAPRCSSPSSAGSWQTAGSIRPWPAGPAAPPPGCWRPWPGRRSAGPGRSRRPTSSSPGCATGRRPPLPPHALVLRGPPPAVRPGAGGHGGLPGRGGGHRGPLPAAALLGPRPGELGPGLPGAGASRTTVLKIGILGPAALGSQNWGMHPEPRQRSWHSRGEKSFLPGTCPCKKRLDSFPPAAAGGTLRGMPCRASRWDEKILKECFPRPKASPRGEAVTEGD